MPQVHPDKVAAAMKPSRTAKQLANDARLRARKGQPRAKISTEDFSGHKTETNVSATGQTEVTHRQVEVIPVSKAAQKAAEEAAMNEVVVINIASTEDPDEPVWIQAGHNGTDQYIQRGVDQKIKLRFLYSLIAAKKTAQTSSFGKDGTGKEFNRLTGRVSTTHKVDVIEATPAARKKIAEWMRLAP